MSGEPEGDVQVIVPGVGCAGEDMGMGRVKCVVDIGCCWVELVEDSRNGNTGTQDECKEREKMQSLKTLVCL